MHFLGYRDIRDFEVGREDKLSVSMDMISDLMAQEKMDCKFVHES